MSPVPQDLRHLRLEIDGREHALELRVPAASEIIPLIIPPDLRLGSLPETRLRYELESLIESIDGAYPTDKQVRAIVQSPERLGAVLQVRNALYDQLAFAGRAEVHCPLCPTGRAELDLTFYWLALRIRLWKFADRGVLLNLPAFASELAPGSRPAHPPCAWAITIRYPGWDGNAPTLMALPPETLVEREARLWRDHVPEDSNSLPEERHHWRRSGIGFRAMVRMAAALDLTPDRIDEMPLGLFLFIDLLNFAVRHVDVEDSTRARVRCPDCAAEFLPVLCSWGHLKLCAPARVNSDKT